MSIECQEVIEFLHQQVKDEKNKGKIAEYIPELKKVNARDFGVHFISVDGNNFSAGQSSKKFSIQSIAKVASLQWQLS